MDRIPPSSQVQTPRGSDQGTAQTPRAPTPAPYLPPHPSQNGTPSIQTGLRVPRVGSWEIIFGGQAGNAQAWQEVLGTGEIRAVTPARTHEGVVSWLGRDASSDLIHAFTVGASHFENAPHLLEMLRSGSDDADTLAHVRFLQTLPASTLQALDRLFSQARVNSRSTLSRVRMCTPEAVALFTQRCAPEHVARMQGMIVLAAAQAEVVGPLVMQNLAFVDEHVRHLDPGQSNPQQLFTSLIALMRVQRSSEHRRVWTGERGGYVPWPNWSRSIRATAWRVATAIGADELQTLLHTEARHPGSVSAAIQIMAARRQTNAPPITSVQHMIEALVAHHTNSPAPMHPRRVHATEAPQPRPLLRERWDLGENVMRTERRSFTDASLRTLLTRHPVSTLPSYARFMASEGSAHAQWVVRHMREQFEDDFEVPPDIRVRIFDVLRLVLHCIDTHQHPDGSDSTALEQRNMRVALLANLDSGVERTPQGVPEVVCHVGLAERMVRALSGYVAGVQLLFLTPRELVNSVAAPLQANRSEPLSRTDAEAFVARCTQAARDMYTEHPDQVHEAVALALEAVRYLTE